MKNFQTIIVARPLAKNDPIFIKDKDGHLFPRMLRELEDLGIVNDCVLSVPDTVPDKFRELFKSWGIDCSYSPHDLPQHRLADLTNNNGHDFFQLLTPYCYLLDRDIVRSALESFPSTGVNLIHYTGTSSSNSFVLCDKKAIESVNSITDFAVSPFVMDRYVQKRLGEDAIQDLPVSQHLLPQSLLFMMLYQGDNGILPGHVVAEYFEKTPKNELFTEKSYRDLLSSLFQIGDYDAFAKSISPEIIPQNVGSLAAQIHFLNRIEPFLPQEKKRFLELGFGKAPTSSMFLLNFFENGIALEPYRKYKIPCGLVETVSKHVNNLCGMSFPKTRDCKKSLKNLKILNTKIQDTPIEDESVDFIFSKTVLEHVADVKEASEYMHRILKKNGRMYHIIDHSDHVDTHSIRFDFLKYDKPTWAKRQTLTNLWRVNDFVELWREMGFKVDVLEKHSRQLDLSEINPCWSGYEDDDLFCYTSVIVAEK